MKKKCVLKSASQASSAESKTKVKRENRATKWKSCIIDRNRGSKSFRLHSRDSGAKLCPHFTNFWEQFSLVVTPQCNRWQKLLLMHRCVRVQLVPSTTLQRCWRTVQISSTTDVWWTFQKCCNSFVVIISEHTQLSPMWRRPANHEKSIHSFLYCPLMWYTTIAK